MHTVSPIFTERQPSFSGPGLTFRAGGAPAGAWDRMPVLSVRPTPKFFSRRGKPLPLVTLIGWVIGSRSPGEDAAWGVAL